MKEVLVTGANGFVGTALCRSLAAEGRVVRRALRRRSGGPHSASFPGIVTVGDIGPETEWSVALEGVHVVIHLAARVHVMDDSSEDPLGAYRHVNVAGTENLARQAAACGVRRLVFISTVKVHGEERDVSYSEENDLSPKDPYGVSKLEAETVLHRVAEETGLEVVIIRPPLVYGPGVKANFLRLLGVVVRGIPLPFASINSRRSMVYLGNLVEAISICATHPKAAGQVFLVSDCDDVSTAELIRRIAIALGREPRLMHFPPNLIRLAGRLLGKTNAVVRLLGSLTIDSSKIKRELGWQPPYTMIEGITKTAEWYNDRQRQ